jgi:enoyl-CoA hydratase/carnithine racemase
MIVAAESARFGHPEQTLGIVTLLGGVYRIAERAGRSFASEWALTSEQIPAATMMKHGVVNRVVPDSELEQSARQRRCARPEPPPARTPHKRLC